MQVIHLKLNFCNYNMYFELSEGHLPLNSFCINTHRVAIAATSLRKAVQRQNWNLCYRKWSKQFIFSYLYRTHGQEIKGLTQVFQGCHSWYFVRFNIFLWEKKGFPSSSDSKGSTCKAGDPGSIPGLGISPGGGRGNPLYFSCLESPMDRGAWRAAVHRVTRVRHDWSN